MAQGKRAGVFVVPIPGVKSRTHIEENVRAAEIVLKAEDLAEIEREPAGRYGGQRDEAAVIPSPRISGGALPSQLFLVSRKR
jgi:diketogulonate reductase-like aldo/keto reductase